jgi:hypothetical protein
MQKLRTQRLHHILIQSGQPTRKSRTRGEALTSKQRKKFLGKRGKMIIKGRKSWFTAERIGEQDNNKINGVIHTKAGSGELHLLLNGCKYSGLFDDVGHRSHFFHPCWK